MEGAAINPFFAFENLSYGFFWRIKVNQENAS